MFLSAGGSNDFEKGVVRVEAYKTPYNFLRPDITPPQTGGVGTGFFVELNPNSDSGWVAIVTCAHVLEGCHPDQISIVFPKYGRQQFKNAHIHSLCPEYDIGIVAMNVADNAQLRNLIRPLKIARQTMDYTGMDVTAYGYPLGQPMLTMTSGKYSKFAANGYHQHTADINPGNSGGCLILNKTGEVIGINAMTMLMSSGMHYAVPSDLLIRLSSMMLSSDPAHRNMVPPRLGFCYHRGSPALRRMAGADSDEKLEAGAEPGGVYVTHIIRDSPLWNAGVRKGSIMTRVRWQTRGRWNDWKYIDNFGDVKVSWNDKRVPVENALARVGMDDRIAIEIFQDKEKRVVEALQMPLAKGSLARLTSPFHDSPDYCIFAGICVMKLVQNHSTAMPYTFAAMGMAQRELDLLVVTAVIPSYDQAIPFHVGDIITTVNGVGAGEKTMDPEAENRLDSVAMYREALCKPLDGFIVITTTNKKYAISVADALQKEKATTIYKVDRHVLDTLRKSSFSDDNPTA